MIMYRFDQIAENLTVRVEPGDTDLECYIGLEHLDPESLKLRRWGAPSDVIGQKLRFWKGDIIYGKRRAYQRKLAVADFEGICSAHAMVLRAKSNACLPEFLPFFLQSETFHQRALKISVGSLSPTINWRTLATQEFYLPTLDEQRRIAGLLWAAEDVVTSYQDLYQQQADFQFVLMANLLSARHWKKSAKESRFGQVPEYWDISKISEIAQVEYGISEAVAGNLDPSIGWPILTGANITLDGDLNLSKMNYIKVPTKENFILKKGDILLNWRSGSPEHVGKVALFDLDGDYTYASFVLRIRSGEKVNNLFLHRLLNYMRKKKLFGSSTSQQVNFKMNAAEFRESTVIIPSLKEQMEIVGIFQELEDMLHSLASHIETSKEVKKTILTNFLV
jgi:type I restriction enzyme S subunit